MEDPPHGARPGAVDVLLTASVHWEPRSPEELRHPAMKAAIDSCRRSGGVDCGRRARPGRPQERFVREENVRVHVFVTLDDVEPGRIYECRTRWLGPDGGMAMRKELRVIAPAPAEGGHSLMFDFWADTPGMAPGRWRVEVTVNGEVEAERPFEVVAPAPADDLQAASPRRRA